MENGNNWFEKASRLQLRWNTERGPLDSESLWKLSLQDLDRIARAVDTELKNEEQQSFIPTTNRKAPTNNDLRLDILKHVIAVRVQESEQRAQRSENAAKLAMFKELAAAKKTEQLSNQSLEEIEKEISKLEALV